MKREDDCNDMKLPRWKEAKSHRTCGGFQDGQQQRGTKEMFSTEVICSDLHSEEITRILNAKWLSEWRLIKCR